MTDQPNEEFRHWFDKPLLFVELDEERKRLVDLRTMNMDRGDALSVARQLPALILLYNNMEAGLEFDDILYWCSFIAHAKRNDMGQVIDVSVDWQVTVPPHLTEDQLGFVEDSLRMFQKQVTREVESGAFLNDALRMASGGEEEADDDG